MIVDGEEPGGVSKAAHTLLRGGLVGLPTETVYGLGADAENPQAVANIFQLKGRPADHPLIIHIYQPEDALHFAQKIPVFATQLMSVFWPGPLTLILLRREGVAEFAAGGHDTVGLRCPSHPVAQALLKACREGLGGISIVRGIAAPSANLFGRVSPTTASHVEQEFGEDLVVLNGGACQVGIESTIVDCTRGVPILMRPGEITPDQIQKACGLAVKSNFLSNKGLLAPRVSGSLASHYAPTAKVRLYESEDLVQAIRRWLVEGALRSPPSLGVFSSDLYEQVKKWPDTLHYKQMPSHAPDAARMLFSVLREFDAFKVDEIWVEFPPTGSQWDGVRDRLQRAAY